MRLYNLNETSRRLGGISRATLYRLINTKKLTAKKVNGRTMVTQTAIIDYINSLEDYEGTPNGF